MARPAPAPLEKSSTERLPWGLALLVGLVFGALVVKKGTSVDRIAASETIGVRPLMPFPTAVRALLATLTASAAIALQCAGESTGGIVLMAVAMLMAIYRPATHRPVTRGPGSWTMMREGKAFETPARRGDFLDASTGRGKLGLALAACGTGAIALSAHSLHGVGTATLVGLDALALLPIFVTGTRADVPVDLARAPVAFLEALFRSLKKHASKVRVVPWARVPTGVDSPDELRLLVLPRSSMPGLLGIEVGVAYPPRTVRVAPTPEILVRVHDTSAAAAKLTALAPTSPSCPGRTIHERVVRIAPTMPTRRATATLVVELAGAFFDRRARDASGGWSGKDRRLPPKDRIDELRAAACS